MFSKNTVRFLQGTIDAVQSHNRRLEEKYLWNTQTGPGSKKRSKEKSRKRKLSSESDSDETNIEKLRRLNAKRRKKMKEQKSTDLTDPEENWTHDRFEELSTLTCSNKTKETNVDPKNKKKSVEDPLPSNLISKATTKKNNKKSKKKTTEAKKKKSSKTKKSDSKNKKAKTKHKKAKKNDATIWTPQKQNDN
ncbi:hypothetical protein RFI_07673 [Reticulomyxa filosa]|uniref:Uncharacterized protein n=1 Tax=Reticulomyxa filosa TaxID=46433 RepID=X6NTY6_RETFI|nr:hypothetical protein RFI_07673 [Reticulomyxa filosa]|eukprot:ETO29446.1 hypothetical protein RFI_07673 [Reticulomyxa filosa]